MKQWLLNNKSLTTIKGIKRISRISNDIKFYETGIDYYKMATCVKFIYEIVNFLWRHAKILRTFAARCDTALD